MKSCFVSSAKLNKYAFFLVICADFYCKRNTYTVIQCITECQMKNYELFGIHDGDKCFCGHSFHGGMSENSFTNDYLCKTTNNEDAFGVYTSNNNYAQASCSCQEKCSWNSTIGFSCGGESTIFIQSTFKDYKKEHAGHESNLIQRIRALYKGNNSFEYSKLLNCHQMLI